MFEDDCLGWGIFETLIFTDENEQTPGMGSRRVSKIPHLKQSAEVHL